MKTDETESFWNSFCRATKRGNARYEVVALGDTPSMATELAELVVIGRKRATAGLLEVYLTNGKPIPEIGGFVVLTDGEGHPKCIWRTTELRLGTLVSVDDAFAFDEGEGDRTRSSWIAEHQRFFARQSHQCGFAMHDEVETVFERFVIVWPPALLEGG
jgi:uncharacterized protein YhfF